ncbi:MAG: hypothetical protein KF708_00845 [Pirellulales bacterium]|nr:hypothetical protein [Pirellulales bacterium]
MGRTRLVVLLGVAASLTVAAEHVQGQAVAPVAPAAPTTLWNFLGIPQGVNKVYDASVNRRGNFPGLERKPPLKGIADPANLESTNPAIKKAAEIKQQEDLAKQKIKAIKYLASIGCGCYPGVKEALMAALDDCTEKVRYEAAKAIGEAACNNCATCNKQCCCDEELSLKLAEVAYEMDDECCYKERSERVREAARQALMNCCSMKGGRGDQPITDGTQQQQIEIPRDTPEVPREGPIELPREQDPLDPPPAPPELPGEIQQDPRALFGPSNAPITIITEEPGVELVGPTIVIEERPGMRHPGTVTRTPRPTTTQPGTVASTTRRPSSRRTTQPTAESTTVATTPTSTGNRPLRLVPIQPDDLASLQQGQHLTVSDRANDRTGKVSRVDLASHVNELSQVLITDVAAQKEQAGVAPVKKSKPVRGAIAHVRAEKNLVEMTFQNGWKPEVGSWVLVYHQYLLERACLGALEVVGTNGNHVVARATGDVNLKDLTKGDEVISR